MPKRKATIAPGAAGAVAIPSKRRKKIEEEALAAAKERRDRRPGESDGGPGADEGVVDGDVAAGDPSAGGEGIAAVAAVSGAPSEGSGRGADVAAGELAAAGEPARGENSSMSPLYGVATAAFDEDGTRNLTGNGPKRSSKSNGSSGGNAFLKSLRKETRSAASDAERGGLPSNSANGTRSPPAPPSIGGGATSPSNATPSDNLPIVNDVAKRRIAMGEAVIILCLFAMSVVAAIYIRDQRIEHASFRERHALEVGKLRAELTGRREVEALLRSGIGVLERPRKTNTADPSEVPTLYDITIGEEEEDLQSAEEKYDWLEGMRLLSVASNSALNNLELKLVEFSVEGGKEKIRAFKEDL